MTVREFLRTVWDGKWYVLAAVVIVVFAALVYLNRQVTTYQATATVTLATSDSGSGESDTTVSVNSDPTIVTSPEVSQAAAKKLGVSDPSQIDATVSASSDGTTTTIQAESGDPATATAVANAFASAYVGYLPKVVDEQVATIDQRLDVLSAQLDDANSTLKSHPNDPIAGPTKTAITKQISAYTGQKVSYASLDPAGQVTGPAGGAMPLGLGTPTVLALSLLAGLAAGVGLALARRAVDFRLRDSAQAGEVAHAPVLAELDGVRRALRQAEHHGRLPVATRFATPYTESIRELRTAVQVGIGHPESMVVVVTASDPSVPKAFVAANLAASWALSGRSTIAVSADLRRPELDDILPAPGEAEEKSAGLRSTQVAGLQLFALPDQGLDPADYLATSQVRDLIESLRDDADVVVIDAPPVLAAADAAILGNYADGVVLVTNVGRTDEAVLAAAAQRLRVNNVPLTGLAVAGVTSSRRMTYAATYGTLNEADHDAETPEAPAARHQGPGDVANTVATLVPSEGETEVENTTDAETPPERVTVRQPVNPSEAVESGSRKLPDGRVGDATRDGDAGPPGIHPSAPRARPAVTSIRTVAPTTMRAPNRIRPAWSPVQSPVPGGPDPAGASSPGEE
ncbi:polysaccharide biosynthesis tyrosine autokinase [Luteimicrobium subarcticum]|uniref:Mrp family chromosome partitioning ATPase n=1 Tax=Luteimicrobium subarcticum TaxID=620910 RepID=A0A2M8WT23_9MICO|nr:polysaccharide biosynthesis tyrosine autokinase [Luteimicrobium subarcticum]PJI94097.1 Mrp family chromosome partitioning ATPase [Luteimicrobium subarcticum]